VSAATANPREGAEVPAGAPCLTTGGDYFDGLYTIARADGAGHRTFSLERQKPDADFAPGERILYLLTGPDNAADSSSWTPFAFVKMASDLASGRPFPRVYVWKSKRGTVGVERSAWEVYAEMFDDMVRRGIRRFRSAVDGQIREYRLMLAKTCMRCGRLLTNPTSLDSGIGPECAKKSAGG